VLSLVWRIYSFATTAADLPKDASKLSVFLADPPTWLPWAIFAACIVVLVWSLWPHDDPAEPPATQTVQTTHGPNSPNLAGTFNAPITQHFHPSPAPVQERKQHKDVRSWDNRSLEGLERVMRSGPDAPTPNCNLNFVVGWVADSLSVTSAANTGQVEQEIKDAAGFGKIHVWGRRRDGNLRPLTSGQWQRGALDIEKNEFACRVIDTQKMERYTDLRFIQDEVCRHWPESGPHPRIAR
jgi:hypothetical protein